MDAFDISASALTAQRLRMDTIASNLANVNTTRKEDGSQGAYRRRNVVFAPLLTQAGNKFGGFAPKNTMDGADSLQMKNSPSGITVGSDGRVTITTGLNQTTNKGAGVKIVEIAEDEKTPMRRMYDPSHPDANEEGWVEMPNINPITEMVDMISATRAYEANVTAMQSAKGMAQAALEM